MTRVLLLIDSLGPGGAQRQMVGLAGLLKKEGYDTKLIYYHAIDFYKPDLIRAGVESECIKYARNRYLRFFIIARFFIHHKPDVVISFLNIPNTITCLLKCFGMRFRLIVGERNTTQILKQSGKLRFYLMKKADAIVPNSYTQGNFINRAFPRLAGKVRVITNYLDTTTFVPPISKKDHDICRIIVVGRVAPQKNVLSFIGAISNLNKKGFHFKVDWFGRETADGYQQECEELIHKHHLEQCFVFHEPIQNIIKEYQESDVCCLPSNYEGFPNVICEAMSCGLPIVCSDVSDNSHLVKEGRNGFLFNPRSIDDMTEKLEKIFLMPYSERILLGAESRKMALEFFSVKKYIKEYVDLIDS